MLTPSQGPVYFRKGVRKMPKSLRDEMKETTEYNLVHTMLMQMAREATSSGLPLNEPIRHMAQALRAWCAEHGLDPRVLNPEDYEEAQGIYFETLAARIEVEAPETPDDDKPNPAVSIWVGGRAWKEGPWGKVPSKIVAMYAADFIDEKVKAIAGEDGDVIVDVAERKKIPAWVLAQDEPTRKFWMDRVATWIDEFCADGWRDFEELRDGSGEVPT